MTKKITVFFIIIFSFTTIASSQNAPGFQGKKSYLTYNFNFKFLRFFTDAKNEFIHDVQLAYVVSRRGQVGLTVDFYAPTDFDYESEQFTGNGIGLSYILYSKQALAPVGKFARYELKYLMNQYADGEKFNAPLLSIGFGTRRVFFGRMVFNIGVDFGILLSNWEDAFNFSTNYGKLQEMYMIRTHVGLGILLF